MLNSRFLAVFVEKQNIEMGWPKLYFLFDLYLAAVQDGSVQAAIYEVQPCEKSCLGHEKLFEIKGKMTQ